jgi:hypothetical protein
VVLGLDRDFASFWTGESMIGQHYGVYEDLRIPSTTNRKETRFSVEIRETFRKADFAEMVIEGAARLSLIS